jgi:uncharacterized protein YbbK (DUF523 family)
MDLRLGVRLRLGVSSCLVGETVRYDGGHKRDAWVVDRLGPMVDFERICPEAEAGLGVPREKIQLERGERGDVVVRGLQTRTDHTPRLQAWAERRLRALDLENLDGYVFKSRSPSCGIEGVSVFDGEAEVGRSPGLFASALHEREPYLPSCTEADLQIPETRRHFLERAQARARWRMLVTNLPPTGPEREHAIAGFLERHRLLLTCREQDVPALADAACDLAALTAVGREFAARMAHAPSISGHVRALASIHDALDGVSANERLGLALLVRDVQNGALDVEVPRQLARGLLLRAGLRALSRQHYVDPVPVEVD